MRLLRLDEPHSYGGSGELACRPWPVKLGREARFAKPVLAEP